MRKYYSHTPRQGHREREVPAATATGREGTAVNIYVASSWRTPTQPDVVRSLRGAGHSVYDFRNPPSGDGGFHWSDIDPGWQNWTPEQYRRSLQHRIAQRGFESDMRALRWADVVVGVQPFGRSASMELGWAAGNGKKTILLLADGEPELMVKMFDHICISLDEVHAALRQITGKKP